MNIQERLAALKGRRASSRNILNHFLPFRKRGARFDYEEIAAGVLGRLTRTRLRPGRKTAKAQERCIAALRDRLSEPDFAEHIERAYFSNETAAISNVSPEFLILANRPKTKASSEHLIAILSSFLQDHESAEVAVELNFIERVFRDALADQIEQTAISSEQKEEPYLPFVAENFREDLSLLTSHADTLSTSLPAFLELYNFLYCSQLALNIQSWDKSTPQSRPLFFLLDTEKASKDRRRIWKTGYKSLYDSVSHLFPILSVLEEINRPPEGTSAHSLPLWRYADAARESDNITMRNAVADFAELFRAKKSEQGHGEITVHAPTRPGTLGGLEQLLAYAEEQFRPEVDREKHEVNVRYRKVFFRDVARHFVQARGRAGRVLVMTQDYLMLLTNLAIGQRKRLRFQELLQRFQDRGVWFDRQSEQALIAFYERVGNIDRMSDSGDAVYVKSTL